MQLRKLLPDFLKADFFGDLAAEVNQIMQPDRFAVTIRLSLLGQLLLELGCIFLMQSLEKAPGFVCRPRWTDK